MRTWQGLRSVITFFCRVYASVALPGVLFGDRSDTRSHAAISALGIHSSSNVRFRG
jgi:hypothetical protein